jgi:allantoate deiminase
MTVPATPPVADVPAGPYIDGARLLARLDQLARIGADPAGGVTRLAFSSEEVAAKRLIAGWFAEAGLFPTFDAAGNVIAIRGGDGSRSSRLATGSHVDSVVAAGPLDGAYGVIAAVEVAAALARAGTLLHHDVIFVAFSNEEGARGAPGFTGSLAVAGLLDAALLASDDDLGIALAQRLRDGGGDPAAIDSAAWSKPALAAFVELHVEQGPVLDAAGERLGVVTSCPGRMIIDVELRGAANHAGTTPMDLRADALTAAAEIVLAVESLAASGAVHVGTTGLAHVEPGVRNVVPGLARLGIDLRDGDDSRLAAAVLRLEAEIEAISDRRGVAASINARQAVAAAGCDPAVQEAISHVAGERGFTARAMPSGAGHDAQIVAALGPVGMIFVPSSGGRSHCPEEATDPADLVLGAEILLATLLQLDILNDRPEVTS